VDSLADKLSFGHIKDPAFECMSLFELRQRVELPGLQRQLDYVAQNSPFYRRKYKDVIGNLNSLHEIFFDLPFTLKDELINDQFGSPPFGNNLCVSPQKVVRVHRTSGTTNRPVIIAMTKADIAATVVSGARCFWSSGLRPEHLVAHCLNYCLWMGGYTDHQSLEATGATVIPYGVGNSRALLDVIRDYKVSAIHCTPSYLAILEDLLRNEFDIKPTMLGLKLGLFGGESGVQDPNFRQHIESVWGIKAMNANYGMADVLSMFGAECYLQNGLHFMGQGNILVEIIDPVTNESLPIEKGVMGELVITNINREAQPVIRFRTRDMAQILDHNPCACGRKSFRFNVIGRSDDMIVVKGVNIFPNLIKDRLARFLDKITGHFQIVLDSPPPVGELKLKVEFRGNCNQESADELVRVLIDDFDAKINVRPRIELVPEGELPRTTGKTSVVIKNYLSQT